jgi:hypothetical protein
LVLIVVGLFVYQQWQLVRLRNEWDGMKDKVDNLTKLREKIKKYSPWFDNSHLALSVLDELTKWYPETGAVTVKTIEIRDGKTVTCSGNITDNAKWLETYAKLQKSPAISDLKLLMVRGTKPQQYSYEFHWNNQGGGM